MKHLKRPVQTAAFALVLGVMTCRPHAAFAELPPGSYNALRAEAEEALIVTVTAVTAKDTPGGSDVTVEADVLSVERSKGGLKKGAHLVISYSLVDPQKKPGFAGPRAVPLLEKDAAYPAFLKKAENGTAYAPAAYGLSFTMTPEKR